MIKRLLLLCLLFSPYAVHAQVSLSLVPCIQATNTPCVSGSQVGNGAQGVPNWESFGILNANMIALQAYLNASISSLGTVTTGIWHANTITVPYGGTGVQSLTGVVYGNGSSPFTAATAAQILSAFSGTCNSLTYARGDGSCQTPSGSGSVTSVALEDGSTTPLYSISGSPVTGAGTLEFTLETQSANCVVAGPSSGSAAQPTCRGIVSGDLPATQTELTTAANLTTVGTIAHGTWQGTGISPTYGGTGNVNAYGITVNNNAVVMNMPASGNAGTLEIVQNSQSSNYGTVLSDNGKQIYNASASAITFTIPANSSVAYPIGTAITFVNPSGGGVVTIAITTDTMYLSPTGSTGSRTLQAVGIATAIKIGTTTWMISGSGIS